MESNISLKCLPPHIREATKELEDESNKNFLANLMYRNTIWDKDLKILPERAAGILFSIYITTQQPLEVRTMAEWVNRFADFGVKAGEPDPSREITVYRGARRDHPHGLSWTPYYDVALGYALALDDGAVFCTRVSVPEILRVQCTRSYPTEPVEVLFDSRGREIVEVCHNPRMDYRAPMQ